MHLFALGRKATLGWRAVSSATPGIEPASGQSSVGFLRLATDSIGSFSLTLTNLVVGSAVRVEVAGTGALLAFRTATATTEVFSVPAYTAGNPANSLRIKVRKGTAAPFYQPFETLTTAFVGAQSIYIAQTPDE